MYLFTKITLKYQNKNIKINKFMYAKLENTQSCVTATIKRKILLLMKCNILKM